MAYTCSYCKTGVMNTAEQYLTHIHGAKHKKKSFQLQAVDDGIEYDEFKVKTDKIVVPEFIEKNEDFPNLSTKKNGVVNVSVPPEYSIIKKGFKSVRPIVVYEECWLDEQVINEDNDLITIDDIFFKQNAKIESAKYIVRSYLNNQKTATQALNEISKAMLWEIDYEPVPAMNYRFGLAVLIDGIEFTIGEGDNKKEAKQNASAEAINEIKLKLSKHKSAFKTRIANKKPEVVQSHGICSIADSYRNITLEKIRELSKSCNRFFVMPDRYAAFIVTERFDQQAREGTIVAFGSGSGVLNSYEDSLEYPGYYLKSFDSLVLARRSLQCFFYNQILLILDKKRQQRKGEKIFFEISKSGFIKFRHGCRLHLYMSHAPYGDCVTSIPYNWKEPLKLSEKEIERDKNGILEPLMCQSSNQTSVLEQGHIRIATENSKGDWISLLHYRRGNKLSQFITLSPTDKLMTWIHVGIQGAMLSHLMDPVFLYSIQFGKEYMHEHVSRALICRVPLENIIKNRGFYYDSMKYFDPYLERVSELQKPNYQPDTCENSRVCFNWYMNPVTDCAEVIDTNLGCVHPDSPYRLPEGEESGTCSRLSKICMFMRLKESITAAIEYFAMRPEYQRTRFLQGINQAAKFNYSNFKSSATDYRQLKQCLFDTLATKNYGEWLPNTSINDFNLLDFYEI